LRYCKCAVLWFVINNANQCKSSIIFDVQHTSSGLTAWAEPHGLHGTADVVNQHSKVNKKPHGLHGTTDFVTCTPTSRLPSTVSPGSNSRPPQSTPNLSSECCPRRHRPGRHRRPHLRHAIRCLTLHGAPREHGACPVTTCNALK